MAAGLGLILTMAAAAVPRAPVTNLSGELYSVSGTSASDVWAAGSGNVALMLRWTGTRWAKVAVPDNGAGLSSVSADSARDAWAVGNVAVGGKVLNVALHWNGTRWAKVAMPSPGVPPIVDQIFSVSALSPDDAWADGYFSVGNGHDDGLVLHWNGTAWTRVAIPQPVRDNLLAITAVSPGDVWAVGQYFGPHFSQDVLVLHWNGTSWARVAIPRISGYLTAVSVRSASDIWAVGSCCGGFFNKSLVLHWNGTTWTRQASPSPGTGSTPFSRLYGVTALSATDAWAVGYYGHFTQRGSVGKPLIMHWNGTRWAQTAGPSFGSSSGLESVQALSPTDAWAAGGVFANGDPNNTLVLHWNGTRWTRA